LKTANPLRQSIDLDRERRNSSNSLRSLLEKEACLFSHMDYRKGLNARDLQGNSSDRDEKTP
jgi:hypothetical protein